MYRAHFHPERKFLEGCSTESGKRENLRAQNQLNKVRDFPTHSCTVFLSGYQSTGGRCRGVASLNAVLLAVFLGLRLEGVSAGGNKCQQ